eukprot:jgi/Tetstr1/441314/TSEL_029565.t1
MEEVEELRAACLVAKEETAAVRVKLRNAVTKGKAIDEERRALQARLTAVMVASTVCHAFVHREALRCLKEYKLEELARGR